MSQQTHPVTRNATIAALFVALIAVAIFAVSQYSKHLEKERLEPYVEKAGEDAAVAVQRYKLSASQYEDLEKEISEFDWQYEKPTGYSNIEYLITWAMNNNISKDTLLELPEWFSQYLSPKTIETRATGDTSIKALASSYATEIKCTRNYEYCKNNEQLVAEYKGVDEGRAQCARKLEAEVKYGRPDWGTIKFGEFSDAREIAKTGMIRFIDRDVRVANAFGVLRKARARCSYNLSDEIVESVSIQPR